MVGEICGYTLYKSNTELPFKIVILSDASAGAGAKIVLDEGFRLDHEQVPEYIFEIAANGCTPDTRAERWVERYVQMCSIVDVE